MIVVFRLNAMRLVFACIPLLGMHSLSMAADAPTLPTPTPTASVKPKSIPSASGGTSKGSNVLDFDADVIEGERSGPSILVQMDLQAPNLDTLVFQRKNFNDFHSLDMKRKPKYRGQ